MSTPLATAESTLPVVVFDPTLAKVFAAFVTTDPV